MNRITVDIMQIQIYLSRMPETICRPCLGLDCFQPDDLAAPIDSALYSSLDYSFTVQCPNNCFCPAGSFPRTISILASVIPPVLVPINEGSGQIILRLQGCQSLITRTLSSTSTQSEIAAAAQSMQAEWAGQQALCNALLVPDVNCTQNNSIDVCNDAQTFFCPIQGGTVTVAAGTFCQTLSIIGLTQAQIDAAVALLKAQLNELAKEHSCSFLHIFCSMTSTDVLFGTEWTLRVDNLSANTFDSSSFKIFDNTTNAFLQAAIPQTIAPGALNIVVLDAQPGVPPAGFYMTYNGVRFFTYPNNLAGHTVTVHLQICAS